MSSTLEDIAVANVAVLLYNDPAVRKQLVNSADRIEEWKIFINNKVSKLFLPPVFQKKVAALASRVGLEIRTKRENDSYDAVELFVGRKIVEILSHDQQLHVKFRFYLVCEFNLENDIIRIWQQMSRKKRRSFYRDDLPSKVKYWVKLLSVAEGKMFLGHSRNMRQIVSLILDCFKGDASLKFQFEILSPTECNIRFDLFRHIRNSIISSQVERELADCYFCLECWSWISDG
ncbi:hypothetical protein AVEN_92705-1 [Araneus ventricosus]|uniref:Uncharacterized protein n=1 Tax=Araneus ventricosus TaxID=182803 RepID=A0A4Y2T3N0_ARAVE|nr:hypothetical protein AVEN_92705-1 [Araneus ventricosus]